MSFMFSPEINRDAESTHNIPPFPPFTNLATLTFLTGRLRISSMFRLRKSSNSSSFVCFQFDLVQITGDSIVVITVLNMMDLMIIML